MENGERLNKININKKAKVETELGKLTMGSIILEICPNLTKLKYYMHLQKL